MASTGARAHTRCKKLFVSLSCCYCCTWCVIVLLIWSCAVVCCYVSVLHAENERICLCIFYSNVAAHSVHTVAQSEYVYAVLLLLAGFELRVYHCKFIAFQIDAHTHLHTPLKKDDGDLDGCLTVNCFGIFLYTSYYACLRVLTLD